MIEDMAASRISEPAQHSHISGCKRLRQRDGRVVGAERSIYKICEITIG
jgi:hypothetical protein